MHLLPASRLPFHARVFRLLAFFCTFLFLAPVQAQSLQHTQDSAMPHFAELDLRQQDWGQARIFTLDTEWAFYWRQLLTPATLPQVSPQPETFKVPGLWNHAPGDAADRDAFGYATLALRVLVPDQMGALYLRIPDMPSAYRLWINGELAAHNGRPGMSPEQEVPAFLPKVVAVEPRTGQLEILLQVSNYHHKEGGIWHSFKLTDASGRHRLVEVPLISDVFVFTILFTIGIYHLAVFAMRRQEKAALFFGLFCLVIGARGLLVGQRLFYFLEVGSWTFLQRQEHLLVFVSLPLFAFFYRALFPQEVKARFVHITLALSLLFVAATILLPVHLFTQLTTPYQILILSACAYMAWVYRQVWRERRPGAGLFGLSFVILFLAVVHDVLYTNFLVKSSPLVHFGVVGFVITQAALLNRRYVHSLQLVEDMSAELRRRNRELEQLNQFKDDFLATTSHELRTPLHGIAGLAELLLTSQEHPLSEHQRQQLQLINASAKRLGGLVNDILDYSAIKHGSLQLNLQNTDAKSVAQLVLSSVRPLLLGKRVDLELEFDEAARYVFADENRLQQILFNLVGNSVKFTEQGTIRVSARLRGDRVALSVTDTGVGIAAEKVKFLFRPYESVDLATAGRWGSSGLGLTICRQLVERHGGTLVIQSEEGEGTQVTFDLAPGEAPARLPVDRAEDLDAGAAQWPVPVVSSLARHNAIATLEPQQDYGQATIADACIYVVDDEEVNRQLLRQQLERAGYRVECYPSGRALLQRLPEQVPDLVILDLMMPQLNGFQVCERVRADYNSCELPIMMLTARHQIGDIVRALELGANDYLFKPHHPREMLARVDSLVGQRRFWMASLENEQLKLEIERRREAERGLQLANQRLIRLLDCSDEAVLLTDDLGVVLYANLACERLWHLPRQKLAGQELDQLLASPLTARLETLAQTREPQLVDLLQPGLARGEESILVSCQLRCGLIEFEDHFFFALLLNPLNPAQSELPAARNLLLQLTSELTESRRRIDTLEEVLRSVAGDLSGDKQLPAAPQSEANARVQLVELLRLSLTLWERDTGRSKIDLAEESRCWRVYLDGGTAKTRTLDKYLSLKTLPEKPRWRLVVRTALFVRARCKLSADECQQMDNLIQLLEAAFS